MNMGLCSLRGRWRLSRRAWICRNFRPKGRETGTEGGDLSTSSHSPTVSQAHRTAVQGIVFTIGIEDELAGDIVIAADDCRFCPDGIQARQSRPFGGAGTFDLLTRAGWGDAMYHLFLCDDYLRTGVQGRLVQEVVPEASRSSGPWWSRTGNNPHRMRISGIQVTRKAARCSSSRREGRPSTIFEKSKMRFQQRRFSKREIQYQIFFFLSSGDRAPFSRR